VEKEERMKRIVSKEKTSIGPWLYWSMLLVVTLSFGLLNLPYYATEGMGANGYLAMPIALVLVIPPLCFSRLRSGSGDGVSIPPP
jgi:hypothetical protein